MRRSDAIEAVVVSMRRGGKTLGVLDKLERLEADRLEDVLWSTVIPWRIYAHSARSAASTRAES
jgi:hypothetical protein